MIEVTSQMMEEAFAKSFEAHKNDHRCSSALERAVSGTAGKVVMAAVFLLIDIVCIVVTGSGNRGLFWGTIIDVALLLAVCIGAFVIDMSAARKSGGLKNVPSCYAKELSFCMKLNKLGQEGKTDEHIAAARERAEKLGNSQQAFIYWELLFYQYQYKEDAEEMKNCLEKAKVCAREYERESLLRMSCYKFAYLGENEELTAFFDENCDELFGYASGDPVKLTDYANMLYEYFKAKGNREKAMEYAALKLDSIKRIISEKGNMGKAPDRNDDRALAGCFYDAAETCAALGNKEKAVFYLNSAEGLSGDGYFSTKKEQISEKIKEL